MEQNSIKSSKLFKFRKIKKKKGNPRHFRLKIIINATNKFQNLDSKFVDQNKSNTVNI